MKEKTSSSRDGRSSIIVEAHVDKNISLLRQIKTQNKVIEKISDEFAKTLRDGNKILLFGNGGSAADAQHIACEFVGRFQCERKGLPAVALTANTSSLTSIGNDYGFKDVFSRQVEALGKKGDLAVGISTTGNSENVVEGIKAAKQIGLGTVGFCGRDGGRLLKVAELSFNVPVQETPCIQEMHITVAHIICELVEEKLFGLGR